MNTKLTLTVEQEVIQKVKKYALSQNRSLSNIVENYLKMLTKEQEPEDLKLNPIVKSLKGSFKMPENMDYKKELSPRIKKRY